MPKFDEHKFDPLIRFASAKYGVPEWLIRAMIRRESSFNPNAESNPHKPPEKRAKGLMQLMDGTAKELGVTDPFDPDQNIEGGTRYIADLIQTCHGDLRMALAAYNAGLGNVRKHKGIPPFPETQKYVEIIMGEEPGGE
jgi:soluble lytic murein transglycosylase-like protein